MIFDANTIATGACLRADVCVVGGGAAGIALALSLTGQGLDVILLEAGTHAEHAPTQALYDGEVADERLHSPPDKYRQRRMGGSTTIWGGRCMPFDAIDFETRSQVPHSGWPISLEDLLPFYPEANALSEAGRFAYEAEDALGASAPPMIRGFESAVVRTNGLERFSCPTDFGRRYARRLKVAPDIRVLLGANCTALRLDAQGRAVRRGGSGHARRPPFPVAARATVLAMGGLETARLMLASRDTAPAGVGNEHDVVGRYYMCHIAGNVGTLVLKRQHRGTCAMATKSRPRASTAGGGCPSRPASSAGTAWPTRWRGCTSPASPTRATATACCRGCSCRASSSATSTASG